jgi:hypothetical protein
MTQDEIIEIASQVYGECVWHESTLLRLEAFVKLVEDKAIAELESQEPVCPECKAEVLYECVACSRNNYPPQRTWQGMTDEDKHKTWYEMQNIMGWYSFQEIANAIEAKLKERNI